MRADQRVASDGVTADDPSPIFICLLGHFQLLKAGKPVVTRGGGKIEGFLSYLAIRRDYVATRDAVLETLWPDSSVDLAGQSLNSLVYSLHKTLGDEIGGAAPVVCTDGYCRLNVEAGVALDVERFDSFANQGDRQNDHGDTTAAVESYRRAVHVYGGDLCFGADVHSVIKREQLRARYLTMLARVADFHFKEKDYTTCLEHALQLLFTDPFREDAHRLVMRCYVRRGERAQALRQYRVCEKVLRAEFDVRPEAATSALFDRTRLDPSSI